jgi:tripartite-type tricarboxylate transporter receptor subunit TctC
VASLWAVMAGTAFAQDYPNRAITMIYPFVAGSGVENTLRAMSREVSKTLGQPITFENRPGAGGRNGVNAMKTARPDGYQLAFGHDGALSMQQTLAEQGLLDPGFRVQEGKDYVPVTLTLEFSLLLMGRSGLPFRDMKEFVAYAKTNPGKLNFAYTPGSVNQAATALLNSTLGIETTLVPYKGTAASISDLLGGHVDITLGGTAMKPLIDSGKVFGVALISKKRFRPFADYPTMEELGIPVVAAGWWGVIAPAGTPPEVIGKLNAAFNAAAKTPEVVKLFEDNGLIGMNTTPAEFSAYIRNEVKRWGPIMQKLGSSGWQ